MKDIQKQYEVKFHAVTLPCRIPYPAAPPEGKTP